MDVKIVLGKHTRESIKCDCDELDNLGLIAAGVTRARSPYEIVREKCRFGHVIATLGGRGEFRRDGVWQPVGEGQVFLNPPGSGEAFRAAPGHTWKFCWLHTWPVFFEDFAASESCLVEDDVNLFRQSIEGYILSSLSGGPAKAEVHWLELIRIYGQRFVGAPAEKQRLKKVWSAVSADPARPWSAAELARLAGMSREQLRLCSHEETKRSPMQQVTHLRMQIAADILRTHGYKQQVVAEMVGYDNAFTFSNAFVRETGKRPSEIRCLG